MGIERGDREAELIAGFLSRRPPLEADFIRVLKPLIETELRGNFPRLWPHAEDIEQSAVLRLCEIREHPREAEARIRPPLQQLARYLIDAPARKILRELRRRWPVGEERQIESGQEASVDLKTLLEVAARLPRGMGQTLLIHAAHMMGSGPPLAEALGIDERSAQKRLVRAQSAVMAIALGEEIEVDDE